jgi:hypothetical protein
VGRRQPESNPKCGLFRVGTVFNYHCSFEGVRNGLCNGPSLVPSTVKWVTRSRWERSSALEDQSRDPYVPATLTTQNMLQTAEGRKSTACPWPHLPSLTHLIITDIWWSVYG